MTGSCLFCTPRDVTRRNSLAYAARDTYPVSPGHSLIVPFRHCADFFDLTAEEMAACMELLFAEQRALILRYHGDHPDPRGGVRHVIPEKAHYPRRGPPPRTHPSAGV
jgi:hypothetical protein